MVSSKYWSEYFLGLFSIVKSRVSNADFFLENSKTFRFKTPFSIPKIFTFLTKYKSKYSAKFSNSCADSEGIITEKTPSEDKIFEAFYIKFLKVSSTCCLAKISFTELFSSKKGGLQTTKSYSFCDSKVLKS